MSEIKKTAIIGARDAEYLIREIRKNTCIFDVRVVGDNNKAIQGTYIEDVKILSIDSIAKLYKENLIDQVILAVRKGYSRHCILEQIKNLGIASKDIMLIKPSPLTHHQPVVFDDTDRRYNQQWMKLEDIENTGKVLVHHLETHAADGCNLNCRGCLHFSNLYDRDEFPNIEKTINDLKYLSEKCEIFQFRILGGEPLLNPKLAYMVRETRKILPETDIVIISNGILIPKADDELFDEMKECNVGFNLSLYPPTLRMKDLIYNTLDEHGIAYGSHESRTDEFEKYIMLTAKDNNEAFKKCISRGIITLKNGRLYKCPTGTYIERYFDYFKDIKRTPIDEGIDIYDENINWNDLIDRLTSKKGNHCDYCSEYHQKYVWNNGKPDRMDWIVE